MILGIDIGGTNVKFGVVDENFNIVKAYSIKTETDKGDRHLVQTIVDTAKEIYTEYPFTRVGIGTPGKVDQEAGICVRAANLPYANTPMKELAEAALHMDVTIANDATCAVCGELYAGMGRKYKNFIMVTLGTGVGGGIVIDGKPYSGTNGNAGEFGHMIIQAGGVPCGCGQKGCYEAYASVTALIRITKRMAEEHPESLLAQLCKEGVNGKTAFDAKEQCCEIGAAVVDEYITNIATGVQGLSWIFAPDAVVFGGAITNQGDNLLLPLREKVNYHGEMSISPLKNDAGVIGAAAMAVQSAT